MHKCPRCNEDLMYIQKNDEVRAIFCSSCGFEWFSDGAKDPFHDLVAEKKTNKKMIFIPDTHK